jgi:hypothetical protein
VLHIVVCLDGLRAHSLDIFRTAAIPTDAHDTLCLCTNRGPLSCPDHDDARRGSPHIGIDTARFRTVVIIDAAEVEKERTRGLK